MGAPYTPSATSGPCYDKRGTDSTSDDGPCKLEDGTTAFSDTVVQGSESVATAGKVIHATSTAQSGTYTTSDVSSGTSGAITLAADTSTVKSLRVMYKTGTTQGLRAVTGGTGFVPFGVAANFATTPAKVTMEVMDSTGTFVGSGSASSTL